LECWVLDHIDDCHVIRLPGLFGRSIKKNFIFDMMNIIPAMLTEQKYKELADQSSLIQKRYIKQLNGFYKCMVSSEREKSDLRVAFQTVGFSAVNFTDSRGVFQFYNLANLWEHISIAIQNDIRLLHLAVEPLTVNEIYKTVRGKVLDNKIMETAPIYDCKTIHDHLFGGDHGYIFNKQQVLNDIVDFVGVEI
jgi:hypothetical protein